MSLEEELVLDLLADDWEPLPLCLILQQSRIQAIFANQQVSQREHALFYPVEPSLFLLLSPVSDSVTPYRIMAVG